MLICFSELFDDMTLQPFLEDLEQIYDRVLAEYPELSSLGEINTDLLKQIQDVSTILLSLNGKLCLILCNLHAG